MNIPIYENDDDEAGLRVRPGLGLESELESSSRLTIGP